MAETKSDRRVRKTKKAIREAFLDLIEEKPFEDITILELTERADVNRKTFYNHYSSVQDVVSEMEDEWVERLGNGFEQVVAPFRNSPLLTLEHFKAHASEVCRPLFEATIKALYQDPVYFKLLSGTGGHSALLYKTVNREKEILMSLYGKTLSERESVWLEYLLIFIMNGTLATIDEWWKKGYPVSVDDLTDFFMILFQSDSTFEFIKLSSSDTALS